MLGLHIGDSQLESAGNLMSVVARLVSAICDNSIFSPCKVFLHESSQRKMRQIDLVLSMHAKKNRETEKPHFVPSSIVYLPPK